MAIAKFGGSHGDFETECETGSEKDRHTTYSPEEVAVRFCFTL